ncbi:MAG: hypothetical protein ACI396_03180 [Acutalibacteraceae bacterium]
MKKGLLKLSSLFLSLAMVLSLFCAASLISNAETNVIYVDATIDADDASTNTYKTLATAVSNATAGTSSAMGTTIMFKSDYTTTSSVTVNKKYITIDLGGYTFTVGGSTAQGISVAATGVVIQNGKMVLDSNNNKSTAYYCIYNSNNYTLKTSNIDFEYVNVGITNGDTVATPGALLRNYNSASCITNVYDCTFTYSGTVDHDFEALIVSGTSTMNLYNCTFDGNGNTISAIQVRCTSASTKQKLSIYNCTFNDVKYLFSKTTYNYTDYKSPITIYSATVNNATYISANEVLDTYGEHTTDPQWDTLTSPYTFEVTCAHSFVDGVCEYCYAPETTSSDPTITMDSGAAMRIDSKTNGIRFSATVDKSALDKFSGTVTDAGMLVAKKELASVDTLTIENSVAVTSSGQTVADGKVVAARYNGATLKTAEDANKYVIIGSLVEISDKNATQQYVARAFIEYTDTNGKTAYLYSDLSVARSIAEVASLIRQEGLAKPVMIQFIITPFAALTKMLSTFGRENTAIN